MIILKRLLLYKSTAFKIFLALYEKIGKQYGAVFCGKKLKIMELLLNAKETSKQAIM